MTWIVNGAIMVSEGSNKLSKNDKFKGDELSRSDCSPFVNVGKEEMHKYLEYEVSMTVYMGRIADQRKVPKLLPFKDC